MKGLKRLLEKEKNRLAIIIEKAKENLMDVPEGSLRVSSEKNRVQFYHRIDGVTGKNGRYIRKKDEEIALRLAQKMYVEKVFRVAQKRYNQISRLLNGYEDDEIEMIYQNETEERKSLIVPIEPTLEQKIKEWEAIEYEGKEFKDGDKLIMSEKGERVRSKTERDLANYFFHNNIPYKYEKPLYLKGFGIVYPDFTFLSRTTGQEIFWEHEGMIDDSGYARKAVRKIQSYEKNGIFPGERLILTYETEESVLNMWEIELLAKRYLT